MVSVSGGWGQIGHCRGRSDAASVSPLVLAPLKLDRTGACANTMRPDLTQTAVVRT